MTDNSALQRYQYLLRTSAPDQIEKAHEQAFSAMSETERREVLQALSGAGEQASDASASSLARAATRYEMVKPGGLQQLFGSMGGTTPSLGRTALASLAAGFVGSAVWDGVTGGDGIGGRAGILSRLFGMGRGLGGYDHGPGMGNGFGGGPHADIGRGEFGGFGGGGFDGPGGFDGGGPGGPGGGPGGPGGGPGGPGGF